MKKLFLLPLFLIFANMVHADQLAFLTKAQAEQTVAYFNDNDIKEVVLWCACCDHETKVKASISGVYYREVKESPGYYEVVLKGTYLGSEKLDDAFDLAYVHVPKNGKWACLGKELGFDCDPCTKPFKF